MKTNAARELDKLGIRYELRDYEVDPDDLSAIKVAAQVGLPPEQVFKTLVAKGETTGIVMAVIPGNVRGGLESARAGFGQPTPGTLPGQPASATHGVYPWWRDCVSVQKTLPRLHR